MSDPASRTINLDPAAGGLSIPRLYFALLRQRFTGTLTLGQRDPAGPRTVWLRGGMPVACDWVAEGDRLGELLIRAGKLDPAGLERGLTAHASGNGKLGEILVGLQLIDAATLTEALREQCMSRLVLGFAADSVEHEATITAIDHGKGKSDELVQVNVLALLLRGVTTHYNEREIAAELGGALGTDLVATPALPRYERQFGFETSDAVILAALARGVTMVRLMVPGVDPLRAQQLVYTLWAAQMLRVGDDAIQAIAKGATAAAAAQELGVTIGAGSPTPPTRRAAVQVTSQPITSSTATSTPSQAKPPAKSKPQAPEKPQDQARAQPPAPAPTPAEPTPAPDDGQFEADLVALEAKIADQAHAFALFNLQLDADRKQVRTAWAELSKTFHPDTLEGAGRSDLRDRVGQVFAALSEGYGVLSNNEQRENLREALAASGGTLRAGEDTAKVVRNAFEAELLARDADKLLQGRDWVRASELYTRAHALSPKDSDIEAALVFADFRNNGGEPRAIILRFTQILDEAPNCGRALYFKGLIELGVNDTGAAKQSFAQAHRLDPRNIDAERQLRAILMRERNASTARAEAKEDKKRGFGLRGFFKKD